MNLLIDTTMIRNIKEIESIKIQLLDNITNIFKTLEFTNEENQDIKGLLERNISLTQQIASKLDIDMKG